MKNVFLYFTMASLPSAIFILSIVTNMSYTAAMDIHDTSNQDSLVLDNNTEVIQRELMSGGNVQLKLHWERGYGWNENNWCAACKSGDCSDGRIVLEACNKNDKSQRFNLSSNKISPGKNSKGCLTHRSRSRMSIQTCRSSRDSTQEIKIKRSSGNKFQIIGNDGCLSVKNDFLRFSSCKVAKRNDVLYWESGTFSAGSNNGDDEDEEPDDQQTTSSGRSFQLKLYWQQGFNWQNHPKEKAWCLECKDECKDGKRLYVRECNTSNRKQKFVFKNNKFSPSGAQGLCAHFNDVKSELRLGGCGAISSNFQTFTEKKFSNNKFRYNVKSRCLTQHHHPRDHEKVRLGPCTKAARDNTVFWVKGSFGGHKG